MSYEIGNPEMAWLLLIVPVVALLLAYSTWANRTALAKFGADIKANANPSRTVRGFVSSLMLLLGIVLLVLACMDIRWGKTTREVPQKGLEIVFALDVSRSMFAEDARPNRLSRAKQQIADMIGEMAGDRVGLVVFAGEATQAVPLTNHYNDFRQKLETVGPHSVSTGGSQLGVAIQAASDAFLSKTSDHRTIVLFTDGEDQESQPIELAKKLHAENEVRIFTVGLGDLERGARIPQDRQNASQFIEHQGQQVWSKLNGRILRQIATETQAAYIPAGTKRVNMADVYHTYIASIEKSEFESAKINAFIPRFQWFAFPAFVCLFIYSWLGSASRQHQRSRRLLSRSQTVPGSMVKTAKPLTSTGSKAAAILVLFLPGISNAQSTPPIDQSVAAQINAANELVRQTKHSEAIEAFNAIEAVDSGHQDSLNYNLAGAHYHNSDFDAASTLFSETARSSNDRIAADSRYNLGNCHFAKALPLAQQQPDDAIMELEKAIQHYRSALRIDRKISDARENLERARKLIEQLKQKQKEQQNQEQQQSSQDQQQQNQNQNQSENSDQNQQNQSDESEQSSKDQNQPKSEQEQSDNSNESESKESQSDEQQDSEQGNSEDQNSQPQQPEDQKAENQQSGQSDSADEPQDPSSSQQNNQPDGKQDQGDDRVSNELGEQNDQQDDTNVKETPQGKISTDNETPPGETNGEPMGKLVDKAEANGMMSRQEALKLLQAVRDRDMLRRLRQQQRQRQLRVRVEKDW